MDSNETIEDRIRMIEDDMLTILGVCKKTNQNIAILSKSIEEMNTILIEFSKKLESCGK